MPFMDLIKNAIFEEVPKAAQQPGKPAGSSAPVARPMDPAPAAYVPMGTRDNQFYARLAKQTDLSAVPELAKIEAFAAPLASVITDKALRYKAALATAQSQGGLTKDAILKGFDALLNVLNSSASTFNKQTDDVSRTEVDAKISQISDINESSTTPLTLPEGRRNSECSRRRDCERAWEVHPANGRLRGPTERYGVGW